MTQSYVVAVYEVDRSFGGHEEGGWYYDTGELVRTVKVFKTEDQAFKFACRFNYWLERLCKPKYSKGSVCYEGREYEAQVYETHAPKHYPANRPHYE